MDDASDNDEYIDVEYPPNANELDVESIAQLPQTNCYPETSISDSDITLETRNLIYDNSNGAFCFETEELALKGNTDYKNILQAIVMLEAQKDKAIQDCAQLKTLKEEALSNPYEFVKQLESKQKLHIPKRQKIHPVPTVDWGKYCISGNPAEFSHRQLLRIANQTAQYYSQSNSMKQNWNKEDIKKLEELIKEITKPSESIQWKKVADHFPNRSISDVTTQAKELGFTINNSGISYSKKELNPEFEEDHSLDSQSEELNELSNNKDFEGIDEELYDTDEFRELILLKRVLKRKLKPKTSLPQHNGYRCCRCKNEPIVGIRWHCIECKPPLSIDFCEDCVECIYEVGHHTSSHKLEEIYHTGFMDKDYMHFLGNDYNYLDPNYMPAT